MGRIQSSINQLIFQATLIKSLQDKKAEKEEKETAAAAKEAKQAEREAKQDKLLESKQAAIDEKLKSAQLRNTGIELQNQTYEQRLKNEKLKGEISSQRLQKMQQKATASANEQIQAKYDQKKVYKERLTAAQKARMDLTAPHKPLPKQGE